MTVISRDDAVVTPRATAASAKQDTIRRWLTELDGYYEEMQTFDSMEADEIFRKLSAWTSRMSHIRSLIQRNESKLEQAFRTKQCDPFIVECERQFKIWSRVFSVQAMDASMSRSYA